MDKFPDTEEIRDQLKEKELTSEEINSQIEIFEKGIPPVHLVRSCNPDNGIVRLTSGEESEFVNIYEKNLNDIHKYKFVPASGAASRMFKSLINDYTKIIENKGPGEEIKRLVSNLHSFAFNKDIEAVADINNEKDVLERLLFSDGLNYSNIPKGLIKFHSYPGISRTAFEEHLVESREYIGDESGNCNIHFTVSPEYRSEIENYLEDKLYDYQDNNIKFNLSYSIQNPATDTIAVDMNNKPIVNENGGLTFRPAGHGALINNLNKIDSDIIFIKNIDNITTEKYLPETIKYKKVIGGYLLSAVNKIKEILLELEDVNIDNDRLLKIIAICKSEYGIEISQDATRKDITDALNRPIRVCGVVKNEGEPGGGPFWIKKEGVESKQIVESAQVDMADDSQKEIWNSSTHFNPVDIVCSVRDYKGKKFDLDNFIDKDAGIITTKSANGREIKALELPGLWNGAMADWITLFVEVPLITFNPVKTVFDLLRKEHQN